MDRDPRVKEYMAQPPMVAYTRTKSLRDILCRSKLPPSTYRLSRRQATQGYKKCGRVNCPSCLHSTNKTSHTCNFTGQSFPITNSISCHTPGVVYTVSCAKASGGCGRVQGPQYVGVTTRPGRVRCGEHVGTATQACHSNTTKPVGTHFRLPGHSHSDLVFLPIEKVVSKDRFVLEARETYWIGKYESVKVKSPEVIEQGINLKS